MDALPSNHCPLWFPLAPLDNSPLGVDAFAHVSWPRKLLYAFLPLHLIPPLLEEREAGAVVGHSGSSVRLICSMVHRDDPLAGR